MTPPWLHKGLTQPPWTEPKLSSFYLFISPSPHTSPYPTSSPPPADMRTSVRPLFLVAGGQNVGKGQEWRSNGGCRADGPDSRSSLAEATPSQTWVPKRPRKRQAQPLRTAGSQSQQQTRGRRVGCQRVCRALVQTLDNQLCLSWQHLRTQEHAAPRSPPLPLPLSLGESRQGGEDTMLRQNPAQSSALLLGDPERQELNTHSGVKEEMIQVGPRHTGCRKRSEEGKGQKQGESCACSSVEKWGRRGGGSRREARGGALNPVSACRGCCRPHQGTGPGGPRCLVEACLPWSGGDSLLPAPSQRTFSLYTHGKAREMSGSGCAVRPPGTFI